MTLHKTGRSNRISFQLQEGHPRHGTLTTLRQKLITIGAKVVHHAREVTFELAEVAVPRALFAAILGRIRRLRPAPSPG